MKIQGVSTQTLSRLPYYLNYLITNEAALGTYISSAAIAGSLRLNEVQVRKDIASVCQTRGVPKKGFLVQDLISGLRDYLGQNNINDAILVGAGNLGRALLSYKGFEQYGLNIVVAFDLTEGEANGKKILPMDKLCDMIHRLNIKIAVITVPAGAAQEVCDKLTGSGILGIWNFAPAHLTVPDGVLVQNENMASSLAVLSNHLKAEQGKRQYEYTGFKIRN